VGAGLSQVVHLSFVGLDDLDALGLPGEHPGRAVVTVKNPLREEESKLRTTLLPALLRTVRYNRGHGVDDVAIFEIGKVFFARPDEADHRIPHQPDRVAFVIAGGFGGSDMDGDARPADVFTGTALWRIMAERLHIGDARLTAASPPGFHPGRCAEVEVAGRSVGYVGEIHPTTAAAYQIEGRVVAAELDLAPLVGAVEPPLLVVPSTFPPVEFDLAFLVDRSLPAADLLEATVAAGAPYVAGVEVFDEYLERHDGRKSIALRYEVRAADRTLTNEDVAPLRKHMAEAAVALGAELRGTA
jgi:phenylalanyl-tRNA synthetase beta chain